MIVQEEDHCSLGIMGGPPGPLGGKKSGGPKGALRGNGPSMGPIGGPEGGAVPLLRGGVLRSPGVG